ncbi:cytochrome P450 family protein [Nocardia arizonensis]|uniref:cytochrome P450 family protein n=1 Tax=Nocardia arizonensis TaxID=1141647 RepID=UPI0006D07C82|nr:cytochrome P450 [Nocardia arizonensis]
MSTAVAAMEFTDLSEAVMYDNPYPRYAYLRRNAPLSKVKAPLMTRGAAYMLTRYEDVKTMHSDPRFSSDSNANSGLAKFSWMLPATLRLLGETMPFKDDPDHKRLRNLVHKAFTPKLVAGMADDITRITDDLIERAAAKGEIDFIDDFAMRLPLAVIASMLGVSDADRDRFHEWSHKLSAAGGGGLLGMIRSMGTGRKLLAFFDHLVDQRRLDPDSGLISSLIAAREEGDKLSDREVLGMVFLLLLAGHDTTSNLVGSSVLALLENPDQLAVLREDPERIDNGIEELLRFTSPVACGTTRYATEDVEIAGSVIPKGGQVLGMIISANRDETVFHDPDTLDLSRAAGKHLAFAYGTHYCMGHPLARLEGRIALRSFVERFSTIELAVPRSSLRYKQTPSLRGLSSLPLRVR